MHAKTTEQSRDFLVACIFMALLATTLSAFAGWTVLFAWGTSLILTLSIALGAVRDGQLGPFKYWLAAALSAWLLCFSLMHALSGDPEKLFLGFTHATAAAIYGLWMAPLLLVTIPYAIHFHTHTLDQETLARLERMAPESKP